MTSSTLPARPISSEGARIAASHFWELWLGAMFLKPAPYAYVRDRKNPLAQSSLYIVVIGVLTALVSILHASLRYATEPSADAIKNTVLTHIQAMPFFGNLPAAAQQQIAAGYNQVWSQYGSFFVGYPTDERGVGLLLSNVVTTPLALLIGWVVYGALVHLVARGWNPETSFAELLAPLALASSPQLLYLLNIFPQVGINGLVVNLWALVCNFVAIKIAYQTTGSRAAWGALFPVLLVLILMALLGAIALAIVPGAILAAVRGAQ